MAHTQDDHCTPDKFGECVVCGVYHGDPCPFCLGQAFHHPECVTVQDSEDADCVYYVTFNSQPHMEV